eukprot:3941808-Rhodomonas_salina.2
MECRHNWLHTALIGLTPPLKDALLTRMVAGPCSWCSALRPPPSRSVTCRALPMPRYHVTAVLRADAVTCACDATPRLEIAPLGPLVSRTERGRVCPELAHEQS